MRSPLAIVAALALAACLQPPPPPTEHDAGPPSGDDCAAAGERLERLGCVPESACSSSGDCDDFAERCEALELEIPGYLNVPCLARAASCGDVERCAE